MWDGSAIPLDENLEIAKELLAMSVKANTILEIEVGAVGGEEDGVVGEINEKLYTSTADGIKTVEALGLGEKGRYITALTSVTCTAPTSPVTLSCVPSCWVRSRLRSASVLARRAPST